MSNRGRRRWIIDRDLQFRLILVLLLIGVFNFLFYLGALHFFLGEVFQSYQTLMQEQGVVASEAMLNTHRLMLLKGAVFGFVIQALVIVLLGVYFSNRISGPIYRINSVLRRVIDGQGVELIKLRQHDFMRELSDNFNAILLHYDGFRTTVLEELESLAIQPEINVNDRQKLLDLIGRIKGSNPALPPR